MPGVERYAESDVPTEYGSVRVPQFMGIERFSHVMHLTSVVEGRLAGIEFRQFVRLGQGGRSH